MSELPSPGVRLDQHLVAGLPQRRHAAGHQADARFVIFDFLGNADDHESALRPQINTTMGGKAGRSAAKRVARFDLLDIRLNIDLTEPAETIYTLPPLVCI